MTLYVYDNETGDLMGCIHGRSNAVCEAKANEVYGSNEVEWTYSQHDDLEDDADADVIYA